MIQRQKKLVDISPTRAIGDEDKIDDASPMSSLESDENIKEEKETKILTPKKLLNRLPVSLAPIKTIIQTKKRNQTNYIFTLSTK